MAQLKDLIVSGATRLIGDVFASSVQLQKLVAPTSSGGTTYGPGSSGQALLSNGTTVYWGNISTTNTTYTFANGTNGFTVTPSGGSAQTVTVTPSIANNITGSGTNNYLAKFNGANTITSGPQLGSSTTTFLRNDGSWATPATSVSVSTSSDVVLGEATTFSNSSSSVTFGTASSATFVKSYPGASSKLVTTSITPTNGTASITPITHADVTATKISSYGTLPSWSATYNSSTQNITFAWSSGALTTGSNVTASKCTSGTAVTVAKAGTAVTVATGSVNANGSGASVLTGLGTATTGSAITAMPTATAAAQTITVGTNDKVTAITSVTAT